MKRKVCELLQLFNNRQKSNFNGTLKTWNIWNDWSKQNISGSDSRWSPDHWATKTAARGWWMLASGGCQAVILNVFVSIFCILREYLSQRLLGMCYWPCRAFLGAIIIVNPIFTLICANLVKCFFYEKKTQAAMPSFPSPLGLVGRTGKTSLTAATYNCSKVHK